MTSASAQTEELAHTVASTLRAHGHQAFLVGGCVRDRLLGLHPKDYDISTDATPEQLLRYFKHSQTVGAHFGVVLVGGTPGLYGPGVHVEVATFRSEGLYTDGRRPDRVQFEVDPALDAQRRDFTINGLLQDPLTGDIIDYVGGQADLQNRTIRAIGDPDTRFEEDHLRMLRAVRFAARLNFGIESGTLAAIERAAAQIQKISPERVRDELLRILTEGGARRGFELLGQTGLLRFILPEVDAFHGVEQPPEYHPEGDVWTHVMIMLDQLRAPTPTLAMGVLLHDVGKPKTFRRADRIRFDGHAEVGAVMAADIVQRLRFSNEDAAQITALVANHMRFKDVLNMRMSTLKRFLCLPHFEEHLELHRLDCLASNGYTEAYQYVQHMQREFGEEQLRPPPLLTGRDLVGRGYTPGPAFGTALEAVTTAQLDGEIETKEQAFAVAERFLV